MKQVKIFVPATIGNVGPGFDVLGLAIDGLGDIVTGELTDGAMTIGAVTGRDAAAVPKDPQRNAVTIAALAFLARVNRRVGIRFEIERALPVSGGLGSSAAASLAGAMAAAYLTGHPDETRWILESALEGESSVAGSHLDNIAPCYYGGLTLCLSAQPPEVVRVPIKGQWWAALVTPAMKLSTKAARGVLPKQAVTADWVRQMARTSALVAGFALGDEAVLKSSLVDGFAEPHRAPLIPNFNEAKRAAMAAGAIGCSISGAGPTTFALAADEATARAVGQAMAAVYGENATQHVGPIAKQGARLL